MNLTHRYEIVGHTDNSLYLKAPNRHILIFIFFLRALITKTKVSQIKSHVQTTQTRNFFI